MNVVLNFHSYKVNKFFFLFQPIAILLCNLFPIYFYANTGLSTFFFLVKDVYGYFRAIFVSKEVSQRALDLTADALDLNPANYTVWHHRRHLLKEFGANLESELDYCREIIEQHPKNYQVW